MRPHLNDRTGRWDGLRIVRLAALLGAVVLAGCEHTETSRTAASKPAASAPPTQTVVGKATSSPPRTVATNAVGAPVSPAVSTSPPEAAKHPASQVAYSPNYYQELRKSGALTK